MSIKYTSRLFKIVAPFALGYTGYQAYMDQIAPPKYDFAAKNGQPKYIVIVGTGLAGLLATYYLSNYEHNQITVIDRDMLPNHGTSHQNGSWFPGDYTFSWTNKPFYPWAFNAIFKHENNSAKIYVSSAFSSLRNIQIISRFSALWFFTQPTEQDYAYITLSMYKQSHALLCKIVRDEGLDAQEDFGFIDGVKQHILQKGNNSDFSQFLHQVKEVYGQSPDEIVQYSRSKDNAKFVENVDNVFGTLIPIVKDQTDCLIRHNGILDSNKFLDTLVNRVLKKRDNVKFVQGAKVTGYDIDEKTGLVQAVKTTNSEHKRVPCNVVVMATGPQAPYHLYEHFNGTVLPIVQAQGYCFDLTYDDHSQHRAVNVKMTDSPYSYSQQEPGKQRIAALFDLGFFEEPKFDQKRMDFIKRYLKRDLGLSFEEIDRRMEKFRIGMRPMTADNLAYLGPLKHYPNVVLNCGYGPMGFQTIGLTKIVEGIIEGNDAGTSNFDDKIIKANLVSRIGL